MGFEYLTNVPLAQARKEYLERLVSGGFGSKTETIPVFERCVDIRSFALNFEVNAVIYDEKKAWEMVEIFHRDLEVCRQITRDYYTGRNLKIRIKEQVCRLLSPLL